MTTLRDPVLEASMDAVITVDAHGVIRTWNTSAVAMFGRSAGEVIGTELAEAIIPIELRSAHRSS